MNDQLSVSLHELADELRSLFSRNQLPQDRADRRLKRVPATGQSQPREALIEFREKRNRREAARNEHGI
jgi:hypothetical protein